MNHAITIFTTELKYHRELFAVAALGLTATGVISAFFTGEWLWTMLGVGLLAYIIGAISIGSRMDTEKRERTARLLPVSPVAYGIIRFLVFVTYHLMITAITISATFFSSIPLLLIMDLITLFGLNMMITAVFFFNDDAYYIWRWPARVALWSLVILIIVISALITKGLSFSISPDHPKTLMEAVFFNGAWLVLASLDIWIYTLRKSYLK